MKLQERLLLFNRVLENVYRINLSCASGLFGGYYFKNSGFRQVPLRKANNADSIRTEKFVENVALPVGAAVGAGSAVAELVAELW